MDHLLIDNAKDLTLDTLEFNKDVNTFLKTLAHASKMPHLILEGSRGSGKKLRTHLFLREKFGPITFRQSSITIDIPGKDSEEIHILMSPYHFQINPSIHSIYDRTLLQALTNTIIKQQLVKDTHPYRLIVIEDADQLSVEAQESMRRTMENYIATCRFIFLSNREDRIIDPIYSRCIRVKLASPTVEEIVSILSNINNGIRPVSKTDITLMAKSCDRNLAKALHYLNKHSLESPEIVFKRQDYDNVYRHCQSILTTIIKGSDIGNTMDKVRSQLYELVTYCVDCKIIIQYLLELALKQIPANEHHVIYHLCQIASDRDETIRSSSKPIYHVESYCLYLFRVIKDIMERKQRQKMITTKKSH